MYCMSLLSAAMHVVTAEFNQYNLTHALEHEHDQHACIILHQILTRWFFNHWFLVVDGPCFSVECSNYDMTTTWFSQTETLKITRKPAISWFFEKTPLLHILS